MLPFSLSWHPSMYALYNEDMSIKNRVAIITGAGQGVGRATALRLAREGAHVVLFSRSESHLAETVAEIEHWHTSSSISTATNGDRPSILAISGDVASENDVQSLFQRVKESYGRVDILINSAGIVAVRPFLDMDSETWDRVIAVNLRGTFLCCREAFRLMAEQQKGVIINISSLSGVKGVEKFPGLSAYNVSKSGVASLTEILAVEGKAHNIRVCAVSPGAIATEMLRQAAPHLKAGMSAEELADILFFLADDTGSKFNGSNIELFTNA